MDYDFSSNIDGSTLDKLKSGNQTVWTALFDSLYPKVFSFILSILKEEAWSEEVVQDTFTNLWQKRDKLEITTSLQAYIFRSARNNALNAIKRKKLEHSYQNSLLNDPESFALSAEESYTQGQLEKNLLKAIEELPDSCRDAFKMSRFSGMTHKEIAEALDMSPRAVNYQIGLALNQLKEVVKNTHDEDWSFNSLMLFAISGEILLELLSTSST